jgi:hypothetical protein
VLFLARAGTILETTYSDSDAASGPVLGAAAAGPDHGTILLAHVSWYPQLWFYTLTHALPFHRLLWEAMPLVMAIAGAAAIAAVSWRLVGRWAALVSLLIALCVGPHMLLDYALPTGHGTAYLATPLLGALLVALLLGLARRPVFAGLLVALALAITAGCLSADREVAITALVPLVVAAAAVAFHARGRDTALLACGAVAFVAAAVALWAGIHAAMTAAGVIAIPMPIGVARYPEFAPHARLLVRSLLLLEGGGPISGSAVGLDGLRGLLVAPLILGGAATVIAAGATTGWRALRPLASRGDAEHLAATAWVTYWGASVVALCVSWICSDIVTDVWNMRYLPPIILGVAAVIPLLAARRRSGPALALGAAAVLAGVGAYGLARGEITVDPSLPTRADAAEIARVARQDGVTRGYAHYWNAANVTWLSDFAVHVAPVGFCAQRLCAADLHQAAGWYRPKPDTPTFVLTAPRRHGLVSLPPGLGRPTRVRRLRGFTMYEFPYDVASRLVPGVSPSPVPLQPPS